MISINLHSMARVIWLQLTPGQWGFLACAVSILIFFVLAGIPVPLWKLGVISAFAVLVYD